MCDMKTLVSHLRAMNVIIPNIIDVEVAGSYLNAIKTISDHSLFVFAIILTPKCILLLFRSVCSTFAVSFSKPLL